MSGFESEAEAEEEKKEEVEEADEVFACDVFPSFDRFIFLFLLGCRIQSREVSFAQTTLEVDNYRPILLPETVLKR